MPSPQAQYDAQHAEPNSGPALREFRDLEQARANYTAMMERLKTIEPSIAEFTGEAESRVRMVDGIPRASLSVELRWDADGTEDDLLLGLTLALQNVLSAVTRRYEESHMDVIKARHAAYMSRKKQ